MRAPFGRGKTTNVTGKSRKPLSKGDGVYVRFQVRYYGRLGVPVGIFAACHHLRRDGRLTTEDDELFTEVDTWFITHLPYPPFYADGNTIRAVPWFKPAATSFIAALAPLEGLLGRYGVPYDVVRSPDPGTIVYEDEFQIGVLPYVRGKGQTRESVNRHVPVFDPGSAGTIVDPRYEPYA